MAIYTITCTSKKKKKKKYFNQGVFLLVSDISAIAVAMFSILSLKSEMALVTKSKDVFRWMLKSEDTSGSGWSKMEWLLYKHLKTEIQHKFKS